jgi:trk system potassium uptake protein
MRVILVGGGKTLYFLARQFIGKGYHVTIINDDPEDSLTLSRQLRRALVVHGDGSDPHILEEAGARQADVLLALTPHDQDNLIACQIVAQMFGVPRTIAMVNDPDNEEIFQKLGVTAVFSVSRILSALLEEQTGFEEITNLFALAEGRVTVTEINLGVDAPAADRSLLELNLPNGSLVVAIIRDGEVLVPGGTSRLQVGDRLVLVSQPAIYGDTLRSLVGDGA